MQDTVRAILTDLTGQVPPFSADHESAVSQLLGESGLGYSQLNELLLAYGYDRVSDPFFDYLLGVSPFDEPAAQDTGALAGDTQNGFGDSPPPPTKMPAFTSLPDLRAAVDKFRMLAVLRFGNVKYAFKYLSKLDRDTLGAELDLIEPVAENTFRNRHKPLVPIERIPGDQTYYLGYLVQREIAEALAADPDDKTALSEREIQDQVVLTGKRNHEAYLASDHMDVYVATSMRERHEYQVVSETIAQVFGAPCLNDLKIRWFDPTQAYCDNRIDKGLVEALMLRRAKCTLYLAQEMDTLGKDSELASTLAQGKPVIAYVPRVELDGELEYVDKLLAMAARADNTSEITQVLRQLRIYAPAMAWEDKEVQSWIGDPAKANVDAAKKKLATAIREHYDKRSNTLKESHPLGLQVNLETGVANGVLVARTPDECSTLIHRVLTNSLSFRLDTGNGCLLLREALTGSIFRVVTEDEFLTNSFWNFYLTGE